MQNTDIKLPVDDDIKVNIEIYKDVLKKERNWFSSYFMIRYSKFIYLKN
jgi:hypothetical protein